MATEEYLQSECPGSHIQVDNEKRIVYCIPFRLSHRQYFAERLMKIRPIGYRTLVARISWEIVVGQPECFDFKPYPLQYPRISWLERLRCKLWK